MSHEGLEPSTLWLKVKCSTNWANGSWLGYLDSNQGNDGVKVRCLTAWLYPNNRMVGRSGFEPLNPKERIYSPPRLASSLSSRLLKWWRLTGSNRWPLACKASALPAELNLRSNGDPYGIRTRVTAVKGRCLNHLTNGPIKKRSRRDLNPRAGFPTYTLSRGASSASWVLLQLHRQDSNLRPSD